MKLTDWFVFTCQDTTLSGARIGSFANIKRQQLKLRDLWVVINGVKHYAPKVPGLVPLGFDFFVHMSAGQEGCISSEYYRLISYFPNKKVVKRVFADGSEELET